MRPRIRFGRHREAHSQYRLWDQEGKIYDDCNQHICSGYPSPGCPAVPHLQRGAVGPNAKTPIPTCPSSRGFPISSAGLFGRNFCSAIWLLVFLFPMPARAQEVAVTAEADPNPVGVDDQLSLTITINSPGGGAERPQIPKIDGLKLFQTSFSGLMGNPPLPRVSPTRFCLKKRGALRSHLFLSRSVGRAITPRNSL